MEDIPKDFKPFMMLFEGEWQNAIETTDGTECFQMRWFRGEIIGNVPMDEITDWKPIEL